MVAIAKPQHVAARSGAEYLAAVGADEREIWLDGERVRRPLDHPRLRAAAESIARVYDLQLEHADDVLAPSPADGRLVNVTHLVPRSREDLARRRRAF
jgi:aromatic ring hydroxylase